MRGVKKDTEGKSMREQVDISYQIGSQFDGSGELVWTLRRNATTLVDAGVAVPRPRTYLKKIRALAQSAEEQETATSAQEELLFAADGDATIRRKVFLDRHMMQPEPHLWDGLRWFPNIGVRAAQVRGLFPDAKMCFFIGLRNPATLLASILESGQYASFSDPQQMPDPFLLSWHDVIADIRAHVPDARVIAWCHEDLPFVFERVLLAAAGLPENVQLEGYLAPLEGIITKEGMDRLSTYLAERSEFPAQTRARIVSIFADKFAEKNVPEGDPSFPGWTPERQNLMEQNYQKDIRAVAGLKGVELVAS